MPSESPPTASVVIVNFNRVKLLAECLRSLDAQNFRDFEIIVVDNASTDASLSFLRSHYPQVRIVANSTNQGFCRANNQAFAVARGRFFVLLNNDAVADPQWLGALVTAAESRPEAGMLAAKIYVFGTTKTIDKIGHLIYFDGQNRGRGAGEMDLGQYDSPEEILWPDGCAALYRREMIEQAGGFDEDFFAYADDAELGFRGRLMGWKAYLVPAAIVHHHRGSTMGKYNLRRIFLIERNRIWLAVLHFPWYLLLANPFFFLLRLAATFSASVEGEGEAAHFSGFRAKLELGWALLRADVAALAGLPTMWARRQAFRRRRRLGDREVLALLRRYRMTLKELSRQRA